MKDHLIITISARRVLAQIGSEYNPCSWSGSEPYDGTFEDMTSKIEKLCEACPTKDFTSEILIES